MHSVQHQHVVGMVIALLWVAYFDVTAIEDPRRCPPETPHSPNVTRVIPPQQSIQIVHRRILWMKEGAKGWV